MQEAMRKSLRDYAALLGVDVTTVTNWRARLGAAKLRPLTQEVLDTTYEERTTTTERARFDKIVAAGESVWRARHHRSSSNSEPDVAATPNSSSLNANAFESPTDVIRRMRHLDGYSVEDSVVEVVELALADILGRYELEGPVRLAPEVQVLRREVDALIANCRQPAQLQRLYRIAGQLAGALSYMAVNRGEFRYAHIYGQESLSIATFLRDTELQAWVKGTQSFCAYYKKDYPAAVTFAEEGIRLAGDNSQSIRLYANGLARALGKLGDVTGVERAVDAAISLAASVETPSGLSPALTFAPYSEARLMANAATAYLSAREYRRTLEYGQLVEDQVNESDSVWSRSLVRLDVATALVRQPSSDVDHAMDLGVEALSASKDRPIRSVWQRAHELADSVTSTVNTRKVRDYVDELRSWSTHAEPVAAPEINARAR